MASRTRHPCRGYAGVFYVYSIRKGNISKEKIYYIRYRIDNKLIEEKAGYQYRDAMTPLKAAFMRAARVERRELSNAAQRAQQVQRQQDIDSLPYVHSIWKVFCDTHSRKSANHAVNSADHSNIKRILPVFGTMLPSDLRTAHLEDFRDALLYEGLAPQTVKHVLGLVRRLLRFAVHRGLCPAPDPAQLRFIMPRVDNRKTECLTPEQAVRLLTALDEEPDQVLASLVRFALVTGMRRGALLHLRWDDVDMLRGFITLRGDVAKKRRTDTIPLTPEARRILEKLPRPHDSPSTYIFAASDGPPDRGLRPLLRRIKHKAGLPPDFRPLHGLRHTYASWLASSGKVDLYTLQRLLTHENPSMTQRYAHLADESVRRAAAVVDVFYGEAAEKAGG